MDGRCLILQIIKVKNGDYEEYEMLLLQRDQYRKEATQILITYTKRFGDRINTVFEKRIHCIRLKKTIRLCQNALNHGESIDIDNIRSRIDTEMTAYYKQLEEMLDETRTAKEYRQIPAVTAMEIKRIYRKLAKQIHPDINPESRTLPALQDLWNRIVIAYQNNDVKELRELEVLTANALNQMDKQIEINIPDLEEKIEALRDEISMITGTIPYIYKFMLEDPEKIRKKDELLKRKLEECDEYIEELQSVLDEMISQEGRKITWRMNLH